jgi:glycine/D-amino acid oxidase-like deaminating enzyme
LVGGGSGHGFKHGPAVGKYVAELASGKLQKAEPRFALSAHKYQS